MIHETSWVAVLVFLFFAGAVLAISFYLGSKAKSASGYFAAGGGIHWAVNGVAFATWISTASAPTSTAEICSGARRGRSSARLAEVMNVSRSSP